jgi:O-antigen ligase
MVLAVGVPLAGLALVDWRRPVTRALACGLLVLLLGSIVASGSRGALVGAFGGLLAFALIGPRDLRRRVAAAVAVAALAAVAALLTRVPQPATASSAQASAAAAPAPPAPVPVATQPKPRYFDANQYLRLQDDVGHPPFGVADTTRRPRTLTGSSGRTEAWKGAARLGGQRPLLGFGIGTEDHVFVDRYVGFNSNVPENSYIGLFLQLGALGLAAFLVLVGLLLARAVRARSLLHGRELWIAAAASGGLVAGLLLGFFQSFLVAVGNNATAAVWICAFVLAAVTTTGVSNVRS